MIHYKRPKTVASDLGISLSQFWLYVKQGKIQTLKLSSKVTVVSEEEIQKFIDNSNKIVKC